ncbi:hypothetical protein DLAC_03164 [Tieghemostelium lacteum]|uniref:Uncharacterized protein n=1 Tax=Tieghemostelium lacteum TaxID=361077 RepID=A0A152A2Y6_TIELA|nr:hypothetical protein DLAC_03164 [Tieghemostelium lacteum]|eukprot:KYR00411.1 hypothetical protein DLAC_03164 [Tieghemostelium lacteum]
MTGGGEKEATAIKSIGNSTFLGLGVGIFHAFNKTYPKSVFTDNTQLFVKQTVGQFKQSTIAGSLLGFTYGATKYISKDLRGKDDYYNYAAAGLTTGIVAGILNTSYRVGFTTAAVFIPLSIVITLMDKELQNSSDLLKNRFDQKVIKKAVIENQLEQLNTAKEEKFNRDRESFLNSTVINK